MYVVIVTVHNISYSLETVGYSVIFICTPKTCLYCKRGDKSITNTLFPRWAMYVERNIQSRSRNNCCSSKAISIICSECVSVALVIQHAKRMMLIILSPVACPTVGFSTELLNTKCVF